MKSLIALTTYVVALLCAGALPAQTEKLCFTNGGICLATSAWERFPWIILPDSILAGKLSLCENEGVLEVKIPALVTDEPNGIPPEKIVLEGKLNELTAQDSTLTMIAIMKGYEQFPFRMTIRLAKSDEETFTEFQKKAKRKKK